MRRSRVRWVDRQMDSWQASRYQTSGDDVEQGETDLEDLVSTMAPRLLSERFVFVSLRDRPELDIGTLHPHAMVTEPEGMSAIIHVEVAKRFGLHASSVMRCLTLQVHSSLEAVGLTAAVSTALAEQAISANVVAGFYHDHIFVPEADAKRAFELLVGLQVD